MKKSSIEIMITIEIKKNGSAVEKTIKVLGITVFKKTAHPISNEESRDYWFTF